MPNLPPLAALRAFEAAARHLSFKNAAAELAVTPTAISHQIRLLESYCGHALFRRRPRPLSLTEEGEYLFPVLREGFERFSDAMARLRGEAGRARLCVTATNAFAARCLVPRLPSWRRLHPRLRLDIVGTDTVLNLKSGEADVAIRYTRSPPPDGRCVELRRDRFHVVAAPSLLEGVHGKLSPIEILRMPLIDAEWLPTDTEAPTWPRWIRAAAGKRRNAFAFPGPALKFREELHAIEAAISGQGVALCSDVLIAPELANGSLLRLSDIVLPGYGFYAVYRDGHRRAAAIRSFIEWLKTAL